MKKILSILLSAVMLLGTFAVTSFAADAEVDKAILFDDLTNPDITGNSMYAFTEKEFTKSFVGFTMAFDFMPLAGVPCDHGGFSKPELKHLSQFSIYTGDTSSGMKMFGYNFDIDSYVISQQNGWPPNGSCWEEGSASQNYFFGDTIEKPIVYGEWHRIAIRVDDVWIDLYIDGELTLSMEYVEVGHNKLFIQSQHCRYLMDNVVFANNNYNIENEDLEAEIAAGNVYDHTDFNSVDTLQVELEEGQKYEYTEYAGLNFSETTAYSLVDRNTYSGVLPDSDDANALSFEDVGGKAGKTVSVDLTYNGGAFEASKLFLSTDPLITFNSVESVADGCEVSVTDGLVDIKVTDTFKGGTVATFKFDIAETGPAQNDTYRYGLAVVDGSTAPETLVLDAGSLTVINFKLGDVNEDGNVTISDVVAILRYRASWPAESIGTFVFDAADIYKDGNLNARDTNHLIRHLAGWPGYDL